MSMAFIHIKHTMNTGDKVCSPLRYFKFPDANSYDFKEEIPDVDVAVYGGGAIEPHLKSPEIGIDRVKARHKVAWGIGLSRSGRKDNGPFEIGGFSLVGLREYRREGGTYVPCVSCMSRYLARPYEVTRDVVLYVHGSKAIDEAQFEGIPRINNRTPFEEVISFLGSAETVVTNSFHGTYWALLMNKKVICLPFSSKFYGFKYPPVYSTPASWRKDRKSARTYPEALEESREINRSFYKMCLALL